VSAKLTDSNLQAARQCRLILWDKAWGNLEIVMVIYRQIEGGGGACVCPSHSEVVQPKYKKAFSLLNS